MKAAPKLLGDISKFPSSFLYSVLDYYYLFIFYFAYITYILFHSLIGIPQNSLGVVFLFQDGSWGKENIHPDVSQG